MGMNAFGILLALLAFDLGFFKLPFDTEIQKVVKGPKLNTMLAYFNQVSFLFMLVASGCYALLSWLCGPRAFLALLAIVFAVTPILFVISYRKTLIAVGRWIFYRRYNVKLSGDKNLAAPVGEGADGTVPFLVLPNHPAMVDPMLVMATLNTLPLRPLVDEAFFKTGFLAPTVLKTVDAVEVPDLRKHRTAQGATIARGLDGVVLKALQAGGSVLFYPAGHIQTEADKDEIGTRQLAYNICRELPSGVRVLGLRTRGLWGSIWSRKGRKSSPNFALVFLKSVFLWFFVSPFAPRRKVTMHVEDLTDRVKGWSQLTRLEFNRELEKWYNLPE